jgi:hypothetical protein
MAKTSAKKRAPLMLPVVSLSAEHLVMGHLMRRNVLTYKAPPGNEGYDLICMHPDPTKATEVLRIQVKSRYQTDCDRAFPVKEKAFGAFDYVVIAFLNIGNFYGGKPGMVTRQPVEFYTLPNAFVRKHHKKVASGFDRVELSGLNILRYKDELGFELIAQDLDVPYPVRPDGAASCLDE